MNREIVTEYTVDQAERQRSALAHKITRAHALTVDASFLNNDLSQAEISRALAIRTEARTKAFQTTTFASTNDATAILDEDLSPTQIEQLKGYRIKVLQGNLTDSKDLHRDQWIDKLIKYIPTEIIAFYATLVSIVSVDTSEFKNAYVIGLMVIGSLVTVLYLKLFWKIKSDIQVTLSTIAFLAWAISLDNSLNIAATLKAILIPLVTFILPIFDPPPVKNDNLEK